MGHWLKLLTGVAVTMLVFATPLLAQDCAPGQWSTTKFKVITVEVASGEDWSDKDLSDAIPAPAGVTGQRQRVLEEKASLYLEDIANRLQNAAFDCPPLQVIDVDGEPYFLAILSDFETSLGIRENYQETPGGISSGTAIAANTAQLGPWGRRDTFDFIPDRLEAGGFYPAFYKVLAHEMAHVMQFNYDRKYRSMHWNKSDEPGRNFFSDGYATALANYLIEQRYPGYRQKYERNRQDIGGYPYAKQLFMDHPPAGTGSHSRYFTNSFWYHYFERSGGLKAAETVLERRFTPTGTLEGRLIWLEKVLGTSMADWLPQAMAEIVSWNRRYKAMDAAKFMNDMRMYDCAVRKDGSPVPNALDTMTLQTGAKRERDEIKPMQSWCVRPFWENLRADFNASAAGYPFPEDAQMEVMVEADSAAALDVLRLSVAASSGYMLRQCWESKQRDPDMTCVLKEDAKFSYTPPSGPHQGKVRHVKTYFLPKGPTDDGWVEFVVTNTSKPYGATTTAENVEAKFSWVYNKAAKARKPGGTGLGGLVDGATRLEFDVFGDLANAVVPQTTPGRPGLCSFAVMAFTKGRPQDRDGMSLEMDLTKPLAVGTYQVVDRDEVGDKTENALDSVLGYFSLGSKNPQAGHVHQAFNATRGVVEIKNISGAMVSGTATLVGKRIPASAVEREGGLASMTIVADFAFDANMGRSQPYYTIGSSGAGPMSCLKRPKD